MGAQLMTRLEAIGAADLSPRARLIDLLHKNASGILRCIIWFCQEAAILRYVTFLPMLIITVYVYRPTAQDGCADIVALFHPVNG